MLEQVTRTFRIDKEVMDRIAILAKRERRSVNSYVSIQLGIIANEGNPVIERQAKPSEGQKAEIKEWEGFLEMVMNEQPPKDLQGQIALNNWTFERQQRIKEIQSKINQLKA